MHDELERAGITVFERGWLSSNNILLRGDDRQGAVVVDTGYWIHAEQTIALIRHGLQGEPLARVVNTHLDSDHCGGNAEVSAAFGCPVDVPIGDVDAVDLWDESRLTYKATGQFCPRFTRDRAIKPGEEVQLGRRAWVAISSPGHDPTSLAFYQPDLKVLISADALWENGFGVVFPELEGADAFEVVESTLGEFSKLEVGLVIPGHGAPFGDMGGAIRRARSRLATFKADPAKHALHATKVLIKFRLLETQNEPLPDFLAWLEGAPYFATVRQRFFASVSQAQWRESILADMVNRGSIRMSAERIWDANHT